MKLNDEIRTGERANYVLRKQLCFVTLAVAEDEASQSGEREERPPGAKGVHVNQMRYPV